MHVHDMLQSVLDIKRADFDTSLKVATCIYVNYNADKAVSTSLNTLLQGNKGANRCICFRQCITAAITPVQCTQSPQAGNCLSRVMLLRANMSDGS